MEGILEGVLIILLLAFFIALCGKVVRCNFMEKVLVLVMLVWFVSVFKDQCLWIVENVFPMIKLRDICIGLVAGVIIILRKPLWRLVKRKYQKRAYLKSPISKVDKMDGHEFEDYLKAHFEKLGYRCKNVGSNGHDYGVDLIIYKNGINTAVQAKRYNDSVGIKAVQEIVSGKDYYGCDHAMVVTNSRFTSSAVKLANKCGVELWDREKCKKTFKNL